MTAAVQDVLEFWFAKDMARNWFGGGDAFDATVKEHFGSTLQAAAAGQLRRTKRSLDF